MKLMIFAGQVALGIAILAATSQAFADYTETECLGPGSAKLYFVYLHGWDNPGIGAHERLNRQEFARLAKERGWRIAVPRGRGRCSASKSQQCWDIRSHSHIQASWRIVQDAAQQCFPKVIDWGVVGFSNGGYFTSSIFNLCLKPTPSWLVSYGAGENAVTPTISNPQCTPFAHIVGTNDPTLDRARQYGRKLKQAGASVLYQEVPGGGHVIGFAGLAGVIRYLKSQSLATPISGN